MSKFPPPAPRLLACLLTSLAAAAPAARGADTQWIYAGLTGRLVPLLDDRGDRIMDFSSVGYKSGSVPLPDYHTLVPASAVINLSPLPGDNRAAIQSAINQVAALPLNSSGYRGVVQLAPGRYDLSDKLSISTGGILFRGAGSSDDPASSSILSYTGTSQINMIDVNVASSRSTRIQHAIADKVVPAGSSSLTVDSTTGWNVGDKVFVFRPSTSAWIHDIGMDQLPIPWTAGSEFDQRYYRTVTYIDQARHRVFFDAPLPDSIEKKYTDSSGKAGQVATYGLVQMQYLGIENLRGDGQAVLTTPDDENHASTFISIQNMADAFVRNVTGQHLVYSTVNVGTGSIRVTVDHAQSLDPVSSVTGERRYSFLNSGQLTLMENLYSDQGRHDFIDNSPSRGPNVFLDAVAVNSSNDSGPHQRWSTGTLFDNVTTDDNLSVQNRWASGTGHGWTGSNMVVWNSDAYEFHVQSPPGSQNWVIGSAGNVLNTSEYGAPGTWPAYFDANNAGSPVTLNGQTSLYRAQLAQRLASPTSQTREYWVGDFDGFENLPSDGDNVYVHPAFAAQVPSLTPAPTTSLDRPDQPGHAVPLTFEYDAPASTQEIRYALLTLALKSSGPTPENDQLWIDSAAPIPLSSFHTTSVNGTDILTIELVPSSDADDLTFLQDGRLNLLISDDHALDWADLQLTFSPLLPGDANRDGLLTPDDLALLDRGFQQHLTGFANGDFNRDGVVNSADYLILDAALARQSGHAPSPDFLAMRDAQFGTDYVAQLTASLPEPAPASACLIAAPLLLPRRPKPRRRSGVTRLQDLTMRK